MRAANTLAANASSCAFATRHMDWCAMGRRFSDIVGRDGFREIAVPAKLRGTARRTRLFEQPIVRGRLLVVRQSRRFGRGVIPLASGIGRPRPDLIPGRPHRRRQPVAALQQAQHREYTAEDRERLGEYRISEAPCQTGLEAREIDLCGAGFQFGARRMSPWSAAWRTASGIASACSAVRPAPVSCRAIAWVSNTESFYHGGSGGCPVGLSLRRTY